MSSGFAENNEFGHEWGDGFCCYIRVDRIPQILKPWPRNWWFVVSRTSHQDFSLNLKYNWSNVD
jgi:hypothetical protein